MFGSIDVLSFTHQFNAAIALACPLGLLRLLWPNSNLSSHGFSRQGLGVFDAIGMGGQSCDLIVLDLEHLGGLRILGVRIDKGGIGQRTALALGLWLLCQAVVGADRPLSPSTPGGHGGATLVVLVRREHGDGGRRADVCATARGVPGGRSLSVGAVALVVCRRQAALVWGEGARDGGVDADVMTAMVYSMTVRGFRIAACVRATRVLMQTRMGVRAGETLCKFLVGWTGRIHAADGSPPKVVVWPQDARPRWVMVKANKGKTSSCRSGTALALVWVVLMGNGGGRRAEVIGPCRPGSKNHQLLLDSAEWRAVSFAPFPQR